MITPCNKLTFRAGPLQFSAGWIPSITTFLLLYLLLSLAHWQLQRADQKRQLIQMYSSQKSRSPLTLSQIITRINGGEDISFYPLSLRGHYDSKHQFLLDNRIYNHQAGYHVLTPLVLSDGTRVLVNRGWVPLQGSRTTVPNIPVSEDERPVSGAITLSPSNIFTLAEETVSLSTWPQVIQSVDFSREAVKLKRKLAPFVLLLATEAPDGYVREWSPVINTPPIKHIGYAVQWFALALTLAIIYLVTNTRKLGGNHV